MTRLLSYNNELQCVILIQFLNLDYSYIVGDVEITKKNNNLNILINRNEYPILKVKNLLK